MRDLPWVRIGLLAWSREGFQSPNLYCIVLYQVPAELVRSTRFVESHKFVCCSCCSCAQVDGQCLTPISANGIPNGPAYGGPCHQFGAQCRMWEVVDFLELEQGEKGGRFEEGV
jgi:hypothetical protein